MANGNFIQTSFTAGKLTPWLAGRFDNPIRQKGAHTLENMLIYPQGPVQIRPGLRFIRNAKHSEKQSVLIPFEFSSKQAYAVELGDEYIRFYKDKGSVTLETQSITGITQANPAVVTYSGSDTYANGDKIIITSVSGMAEVNNREFTVANVNVGSNTFELSGIDSSDYTAYTSGGTVNEIYEIASPYSETEVSDIKYCQSANILYLFHANYAPRKLSRTAHTSWTLTTINFKPAATKEEGIQPDTTITPAATTGTGVTFTAGGNVFQNGDIGRIISSGAQRASVTVYNAANNVDCDIIDDFDSTDAIASGSWTLEGSPIGSGNLTPSIVGPVGKIVTLTSTVNSFRSTDVDKYIRINSGFVKINSYTSATVVKGEVLKVLSSTDASSSWTMEDEVWTSDNGYPTCGTFFEDRLCLAGVDEYPETIWGSVVGDYENFTPGADDSDSFEFTLGGRNVNVIRWLEPREYLVIGTMDSEWRLGPEDSGSPLTPTNVVAKQQTTHGSYDLMPVSVGPSTLFIQRAGRKIREFVWKWQEEKYTAPDMTRLASDLTVGGIIAMTYQQEPLSIVWCIRNDGTLLGMTFLRDEEVVGWHSHPMDNATIESIAVVPGSGYDELWCVVNRTINDSTVRNVEMMEAVFEDDSDTFVSNNGVNAFYLDSGLTYNGSETSTITGLWHLNGEEVSIFADGAYQKSKTVSNGSITLDTAASVVHVGLSYTAKVQTLRLEQVLADGISVPKPKRTSEVTLMVNESKEFKVGRDSDNLEYPKFRTTDDATGQTIGLVTGNVRAGFDSGFRKEDFIVVVQDRPMPLMLCAIIQEAQAEG